MILDRNKILSCFGRLICCSAGRLFLLLIAVGVFSCKGPTQEPPVEERVGVTSNETPDLSDTRDLLEVVFPLGATINQDTIIRILQSEDDSVLLYQWKNRLVAYGYLKDTVQVRTQILEHAPSAVVVIYDKPFYHFSRRQCANSEIAKEWHNIILTANLVSDTILQREYMEYHTRQQKDWPEVGQGFCRADFQQLLLYRKGRQLMLVISIPEGTSLDELNPRTTENNPRVKVWNELMKKYQEGVKGTRPGEVWVPLQPVKIVG